MSIGDGATESGQLSYPLSLCRYISCWPIIYAELRGKAFSSGKERPLSLISKQFGGLLKSLIVSYHIGVLRVVAGC